MIEIKAADNVVRIKPISDTCYGEIAALYNSSRDMRYATGAGFAVAAEDMADNIERACRAGNEFISGIHLSGIDAAHRNIVGIISGAFNEKTLWIRQLAIHPSYRRKGLGTRSAGLVFQYARERYHTKLACISVVEDNEGGLAFWTKMGFLQTKRITKELFGDKRQYGISIMQRKL